MEASSNLEYGVVCFNVENLPCRCLVMVAWSQCDFGSWCSCIAISGVPRRLRPERPPEWSPNDKMSIHPSQRGTMTARHPVLHGNTICFTKAAPLLL